MRTRNALLFGTAVILLLAYSQRDTLEQRARLDPTARLDHRRVRAEDRARAQHRRDERAGASPAAVANEVVELVLDLGRLHGLGLGGAVLGRHDVRAVPCEAREPSNPSRRELCAG